MYFRHVRLAVILLTCGLACWAGGDTVAKQPAAAPAPDNDQPPAVETTWYDIHDLLTFPTTDPNQPIDLQARAAMTDEVRKLITDTISTNSWKDNGGSVGTMTSYWGKLIITQTPAAHLEIKSLLEKLREIHSARVPTITVDAFWVRLTPAQMPTGDTSIAQSLLSDPNVLWARARTMGFDGVAITASVSRSAQVLSGITPVVAPGVLAYDPQLSTKQWDATLTETPSQIDSDSLQLAFDAANSMPEAPLDVATTRPTTEPSILPVALNSFNELVGSATVAVHTHSVVRLKLGVPTIVSGISDRPGMSDHRALCLVLCATVSQPK